MTGMATQTDGIEARRPLLPRSHPKTDVAKPLEPQQALNADVHPGRVMYYSHDTFGLGHLRRTLKVAGALASRWPQLSQLIMTGSPVADRFQLPEGVDYVKLPAVVKVGADAYAARSLAVPFDAVRDLRRDIVTGAAACFRPDLLLVDQAPAGLAGEMLPALHHLRERSPSTRLVLGLRDVIDEPELVRRSWERDRVHRLLEEVYDLIVVYGRRDVFDLVGAYGLSERAAAKVRYVGYLGASGARRSADDLRAELEVGRSQRLVVVTAGGGGDGHALLKAGIEAARQSPADDTVWLLVTGPLMPAVQRAALAASAARVRGARVVEFMDDMPSLMGAADAVVSMGGYNSVCELLESARPALLVPRIRPRREQIIRAQALRDRGLLRMLEPDDLGPTRLLAEVRTLINDPPPAERPALDGLRAVTDAFASLLATTAVREGSLA
jgi:predicted glycosyltransferase